MRYWLLIVLFLPLQVFAQSLGKITFTEGSVRVIRDASILLGAAGAVLEPADILETAQPGFALIEFPDGTVIALGAATRVMVSRTPQAGSEIFLLEGWLKAQSRNSASTYSLSSQAQSVGWKDVSLIAHARAAAGEVFVESGSPSVGQTDKRGRPAGMQSAKPGQFVMRNGDKPPVSQARPSAEFLSVMPGAFKDALPARLDRFKDRSVEAKSAGPVTYADVADWLSAPQNWRAGFVKRFEPRLADPKFRQQLDAGLKNHPEWERILHPPPVKRP
ncbi:hypothetical protein GCM10027046_03470 [Uliginosibacterium flavum]